MSDRLYISLLCHLSSMLDKIKSEIPMSLPFPQPQDPVSFETTKAMLLLDKAILELFSEYENLLEKPFTSKHGNDYVAILKTLTRDFNELRISLGEALQYCSFREPICYHQTIADYRAYIPSLITKAKDNIKQFLDPIFIKMHTDAEKKYGQPMAFAIDPYPLPPPIAADNLLFKLLAPHSEEARVEALWMRPSASSILPT